MSLTLMETLLWAAGSLLNAALLCMLLLRRRFRALPWFTAWIAYGSLFSLLLYASHKWWPHRVYGALYWTGAFVDMLFQVAVVLEIGRHVLRRNGRWVEGARQRFTSMGLAGGILALVLAVAHKPPGTEGLALWTTRGNLFTAVLVCTLFTGVMAASQQLGLGWRNHAIRVGYGLTTWLLTGLVLDILRGYFGPHRYENTLDYIEKAVYLGSLLYWLLSLWPNEPAPRRIPVPERKLAEAFGKELQFGASGTARPVNGAVKRFKE